MQIIRDVVEIISTPGRDDTAVADGGIKYLTETVERESALKLGPLSEEPLKPPFVKAVHSPAVPDVPIDVQPRRKLNSDTDAVKEIVMPLVGVEIAAAPIHTTAQTAPRTEEGVILRVIGFVTACVLAKEGQPALNIGLERSNDCLEGFIHG